MGSVKILVGAVFLLILVRDSNKIKPFQVCRDLLRTVLTLRIDFDQIRIETDCAGSG